MAPRSPQGRADHRLAAHDDPDRGADRDADRARRRGPLASCNIFSTQTMPPRRLPPRACRYSRKGETLEEYWDYAARIFDWGQDQTCNMILDDGGDATMFALWGARVEAGETLFTPQNEEEEIFVATLKRFLAERPGYLTRRSRRSRGSAKKPPPASTGSMISPSRASFRSRRSTSTTASPSRSSTISTAARKAWSTPSAAPPT